MTKHEFCDSCPGCRPAVTNFATGEVYAPDSPIMIAVNQVWDTETSYQERKAFVDVSYHNSKLPSDLRLSNMVAQKMMDAIRKVIE